MVKNVYKRTFVFGSSPYIVFKSNWEADESDKNSDYYILQYFFKYDHF
jgi:hypothetical protein